MNPYRNPARPVVELGPRWTSWRSRLYLRVMRWLGLGEPARRARACAERQDRARLFALWESMGRWVTPGGEPGSLNAFIPNLPSFSFQIPSEIGPAAPQSSEERR